MEYCVSILKYYKYYISQEDTTSLSYYILLSLIPAITVIAFISHLLHIDLEFVRELIFQVFTRDIAVIIVDALFDRRISYLSAITIIVSVYVCSKGVFRLVRKVDELYGYQSRFYIKLRVHAVIDTFLFLLLILGMIVIIGIIPVLMSGLHLSIVHGIYKYVAGFIFLFCALMILFYLVPSKKVKLKNIYKGAFVSTVVFILIILAVNIYLKYANYSNVYGSFASIAVLLLTCDFFAKGLYLGFVINAMESNVE